ncbi:uncharacterized protein LOC142170183 [Nicotiana tabacum]|uniref:Uncharacterized protein LOC142170183 n=1 Tax=Nicotiana tabacum TaxID=4097 RepID=A0AC58ST25_TOBAC
MVKDCLDYARRCKAFQFHANFIYQLPEMLHPTIVSWSFDTRGFDVVGPLPKFSVGHLYILTATDYISKWAEIVALKEVKKENIANFIQVNIIYRFSIPRHIITNNGKPFDNKLMNKICDLFVFKQRNPSMYNAVVKGLVETMVKSRGKCGKQPGRGESSQGGKGKQGMIRLTPQVLAAEPQVTGSQLQVLEHIEDRGTT